MMNVGTVAIAVQFDAAAALARIDEMKNRLGQVRAAMSALSTTTRETSKSLEAKAKTQAMLSTEAEKARAALQSENQALNDVRRATDQVSSSSIRQITAMDRQARSAKALAKETAAAADAQRESEKRLRGVAENATKTSGAIAALSGAFGTSSSHVGQFAQAFANAGAAMVSGGGVVAAATIAGTAISALASSFFNVEEASKEAGDSARDYLTRVKQEARDLRVELAALRVGASKEKYAQGENVVAASNEAKSAIAATGLSPEKFQRLKGEPLFAERPEFKAAIAAMEKLDAEVEKLAAIQRLENEQRQRQHENAIADAAIDEANRKTQEESRSIVAQAPQATRGSLLGLDPSMFKDAGDETVRNRLADAERSREASARNLAQQEKELAEVESERADALRVANAQAIADAQALEKSKAFSDANMSTAGRSLGEATMSGNLNVNAIGEALGMAAGIPIAGTIASALETIVNAIGTVVGSTIGKLFESKGAQDFFGSMQVAAVAMALLAPLGGALMLLLGPVLGLAVFMAALGTQTKEFANIQMVIGRAFEAIALPLGGFWAALEPLAGAMMQAANAFSQILTPLAPLMASFIGLDFIVVALVSTIATLGKFISSIVSTMARMLDDFIDLVEMITGTDIKGEKGLKNIAAGADIAYGQFDAITVDSGQDKFNDLTGAVEDNTTAIKDMTASLTNIPSGYRVEGAMFDSQTPERGGSGGNARHRNADDARMARGGGGTVIIKNLTVQAKNRRILDEIGDEVRRRYGTDRMPTGPLDDDG